MKVDYPIKRNEMADELIRRIRELPDEGGRTSVPTEDLTEAINALDKLTTLNVFAMNYKRGEPMHADLRPPKWFFAMMVETMAKQLIGKDGRPAANYTATDAWHPQYGQLEILVQRVGRKTPWQQLVEAESLLRGLVENATDGTKEKAITFLNRPRTEGVATLPTP